ncbi:MAG: glycosyltransferase family 39 protein [Vicinamibacterales bacterium]
MKRISDFSFAILLILGFSATGVLYLARALSIVPLGHDVTARNSDGDDWLRYREYAVSVLNDGLTIPLADGAYYRPGGFGYVYFVASLYAIAGVRSEVVYVVQGLLLVGAIAGMYAVFRSQFSPRMGLVFLLVLACFMYADVYRILTFRLLSENLIFPLLPALLLVAMKGQATARHAYFAAAGAVCGLCFLMRPNLQTFGPVTAAVVLLFTPSRSLTWRARAAVLVLGGWAVVASLLPLRNYVVTGKATVPSIADRSDWAGLRYPKDRELSVGGWLDWRARRYASRRQTERSRKLEGSHLRG